MITYNYLWILYQSWASSPNKFSGQDSLHNTECVLESFLCFILGAIESNILKIHLHNWNSPPCDIYEYMKNREIRKGFRCSRGQPFWPPDSSACSNAVSNRGRRRIGDRLLLLQRVNSLWSWDSYEHRVWLHYGFALYIMCNWYGLVKHWEIARPPTMHVIKISIFTIFMARVLLVSCLPPLAIKSTARNPSRS